MQISLSGCRIMCCGKEVRTSGVLGIQSPKLDETFMSAQKFQRDWFTILTQSQTIHHAVTLLISSPGEVEV